MIAKFYPILEKMFALPTHHPLKWWVLAVVVLALAGVAIGIRNDMPEWLLLPASLLLLTLAVFRFEWIFYLLIASLPVSIEFNIGSLGTDLPSEPLMWALFLISIGWVVVNGAQLSVQFVRHSITWLLLLHICWLLVTVIYSENGVVSLKFFVAKIWYVVVFYFLAGWILRRPEAQKKMVWFFFIPLIFTVLRVLVRHAPMGFAFETVNFVMGPFYRNHVMYACLMTIFLPFLWYATYWYRRWSWRWWCLVCGIIVLLVGINLAYTRAAYVALLAVVVVRWAMHLRWMKGLIWVSLLSMTLFVGWVTYRDNFLMFVPNYEHTVTHKNFDKLLNATIKLEDISVMERVYRWVAAAYMIQEKPWLGFGPGNFYFFYKNYTVRNFKTYVSDNPEKSGIHCYYLMTAVEQGIVGLIIFLILMIAVMLQGETIYHRSKNEHDRKMAIAATLSYVLIALLMLMNDFVETDKIGSFFFINMAILVRLDVQSRVKIS